MSPHCSADSTADQQLRNAVAQGDLAVVRILLSNGADVDTRSEQGDTPLMIAAENRNVELARLLLEHRASVSARNYDEDTALDEAVRTFDVEMVRLLLAANPDQDDKDQSLNEAAGDGPVILKTVEAPGLNKQKEQEDHSIPEPSWVTTVRLLLDSGADVEARNASGDTPLLRAAAYGQTEIFQLLVEKGAKMNVRDKHGMTPLIAAACACAVATMNGTYNILKILLQNGVDVNAKDHDGRTALMLAASSPDGVSSVRLLLSHGADPVLKDKDGATALDYADKAPCPDKAAVLRSAISKTKVRAN